QFDADVLRALPQDCFAELGQLLDSVRDRQEMVAGKLAHLARKRDAAISEENFRLADAAGVENHLSQRRIAGRVFIAQTEIEIAEWNPAPLSAPAHMNQLLTVGKQAAKLGAGLRCRFFLEPGAEFMFAGDDAQCCHCSVPN